MSVKPEVTQIGEKLRLLQVRTENTKTTCISVLLLMPLLENTAENAVLASFLTHRVGKIPDAVEIKRALRRALRRKCFPPMFPNSARAIACGFQLPVSATIWRFRANN